jgi:hypothetical protein
MVFLGFVGLFLVLMVMLFTGGIAALPIVLFVPVLVIIGYILWMFIKRIYTRPS